MNSFFRFKMPWKWVVGIACLLAFGSHPALLQAASVSVSSPDHKVRLEILQQKGALHYRVNFNGKPVIETSPLLVTVDQIPLTQNLKLEPSSSQQFKERYPWRGVHSIATNHCNTRRIKAIGADWTIFLSLVAYNDGVAFHHNISLNEKAQVAKTHVVDEATGFKIPAGSTVWSHDLGGHYEAVHQKRNIEEIKAGDWAAPPLTFKLPGKRGYASITEAALQNYSGMALQADGERGFNLVLGHKHPISYPFRLRYSNDIERVSQPPLFSSGIQSPWRVILIGADLNALVNSDLVHNLCPPPDPKIFPQGMQTDWVKPGRAVWKYLDGGPSTFEGMKEFSRWAGELGFEYHVIEGFWSRWSDEQIRELVDFSRQRGVGLWFWRHSRELRTPEAREAFFKKLQDLGVVGAKIDFFDHEHKEVVDLYTSLLEEAAKHRVMVNFHGANKPTGEARTWPNEMIREGVRGMESSRLLARARHNTTLPFTRYLAGHGDYTPVHFGSRRGDTTWAHQVATAAIFNEPLLTYGAHPTNLLSNPSLPLLKTIPAVWDETRVLAPSEIGEAVVFARRKDQTWFLAILNGESARTMNVPLSFLPAGEFKTMILRDVKENPAAVTIENKNLQRNESLEINLPAGGGFLARFLKN